MSGGGIIIQRRQALLTAIKDPSLYNLLPQGWKDKVDAISNADPASCTLKDLKTLAKAIKFALHC